MMLNLYSVHDAAVQAFLQPFFARSHGEALRSFQDACNDPKTAFHAHTNDYSLWFLGSFNDASGDLAATHPAAEKLLNGTEALIKEFNPTKR